MQFNWPVVGEDFFESICNCVTMTEVNSWVHSNFTNDVIGQLFPSFRTSYCIELQKIVLIFWAQNSEWMQYMCSYCVHQCGAYSRGCLSSICRRLPMSDIIWLSYILWSSYVFKPPRCINSETCFSSPLTGFTFSSSCWFPIASNCSYFSDRNIQIH